MIDLPEPFKKCKVWMLGRGGGRGKERGIVVSRLPGESDMMIAGGQMKLHGAITRRRYVRKR